MTGLSAVIGSWKIMEIAAPRRVRIWSSGSDSSDWPSNSMEPETCAVGGRSRSSARDVADFPEPDSPTNPSVSPGWMAKETPSTTVRVPKAMVRSCTRSNGWLVIWVRLAELWWMMYSFGRNKRLMG